MQAFSTCRRVCLSPHRIHAGVMMCFHRCRLALCGSASVRELSANLSTCLVRVEIVADQSCGALLSSDLEEKEEEMIQKLVDHQRKMRSLAHKQDHSPGQCEKTAEVCV